MSDSRARARGPAMIGLLAIAWAAHAMAETPQDAIRQVMETQTAAWNRGDLAGFVETYADSPETLFVGKTMTRGRAGLLERYRRNYPTRAKMGQLSFSDLEIRMLGARYATAVGRFRLARAAEAGGDASGVFSLLFEKTARGWKIIQDHTS